MESESLAAALEREHREIDAGIEEFMQRLAQGETQREPLNRATAALRRHIYLEEEFLFPPLRDAGMVAPIFVMLREHGQLWQTLDRVDAELSSDGAPAAAEVCRELEGQIAAHNAKEEPILYPQADRVLTPGASGQLRQFLDSGRMPEGWVCYGIRPRG